MPDLLDASIPYDNAPTGDDIFYVVNSPGGTPGNRKVTLANLAASAVFTGVFVRQATTNVSGYGWVLDEDTMASNDATKVPTQQSVKAYVDANAGGGDVDSSSATVAPAGNYWDFVLDEDDFVSDSATKIPTQQSTKAYIDGKATLVTSDMAKVPVTTVGPLTILNVDSLLSSGTASFPDNTFSLYDDADNTKILKFSIGAITTATTRTLAVPSQTVDDTLVTAGATQSLSNKTINMSVLTTSGGVSGPYNIGIGPDNYGDMLDVGLSSVLTIFGVVTQAPSITGMHSGGTAGTKAQSSAAANMMEIAGRSVLDTLDYGTTDHANMTLSNTGLPTAASHPCEFRFRVTPASAPSTLTLAAKLTDTMALVTRCGVVVGAGSGMAVPAETVGFQQTSGTRIEVPTIITSLTNGATNTDVALNTQYAWEIGIGPTAAFTINSIAAGVNGQIIELTNMTGQVMSMLQDDGATGTAAARLLNATGATVLITAQGTIRYRYYTSVNRWCHVDGGAN